MGGGAMELAQGMAEKKADEAAEQDMSAYIETFRCTYANGKQVKGGPEPVELPGGNDSKLMSLRNEYITLAKDLKERKTALGMAPGIEAEEILDKAEMGLYDDENLGKTGGAYASLYRAKALNSEEDQKKLDAEKEATSKRIKGGAIALGAGAAVGIVGNSLINGKLGEKIKALKEKKANGKQVDTADDKETIAVLKRGLKVSGLKLTEINKVPWKKLDGIGAVKEYAQGINFGLIPHDEAKKITSMTTTEVVADQVEEWYTNQHKNDTPEDVAAQQQSSQILCEQSKDDGAITGIWDDSNNSCTCKTTDSNKEVTWTQTDGCFYIEEVIPEVDDYTQNVFQNIDIKKDAESLKSKSFKYEGKLYCGVSDVDISNNVCSENYYDDLAEGEFSVQFDYGTIKATSSCENYDCFCTIKSYTDLTNKTLNFQNDIYHAKNGHIVLCNWYCAYNCANSIATDQQFRAKIFKCY
ncbi:MAG: hypothetical protein MJ158_02100 [Alphaproteobacteria bacterium]|nr:hypothetical protein [Alphaproteobacteria bacterium]